MNSNFFDDVYYDTLEATIQSIVNGYFSSGAKVEDIDLADITNDVITAFSVSLLNT